MKLLKLKSEKEMRFKIGDRVWIIKEKHPVEANIMSISFQLIKNGKGEEPFLICIGYHLNQYNSDRYPLSAEFYPYEVYPTQKLPNELAQWHPETLLTTTEWKQAVGDRDDEASLEECELSPCCATISHIRDLLLKCENDSGLIERDVRRLRELLDSHRHPRSTSGRKSKNLNRIFRQLGILN